MSTPWDNLYAAAHAAEMRDDLEMASLFAYFGMEAEKAAEKTASAELRRAGSNAFRSDAEEEHLREENRQRSAGRGR